MKSIKIICSGIIFSSVLFFSCNNEGSSHKADPSTSLRIEEKLYPAEGHIWAQNYPEESFAIQAYRSSLANIKKQRDNSVRTGSWEQQGPGNIGGRVNTIAVNPEQANEMMLGYASGGIFKTTDNGDNWEPVFDDQDILSISDVQYDPNDPDIVYVGTGDHNISGYPVTGDGVYKSLDGGATWDEMGLSEAGVISEIGISPSNSSIVYAASMGLPFERTEDRGLYKSVDGGESWEQVFYLNDSTGVIDIEVHPDNADIVYAATWTRIRNNRESLIASDQTGIFKTSDGGESWERLTDGLPLGELVRPGLAMYSGDPDIVFATFVSNEPSEDCNSPFRLEGIYKTNNAGETWDKIPNSGDFALPCDVFRGFGWYFGKIRVNPMDENDISILSVELYNTKDGGENWFLAAPTWSQYIVHADKHDMVYTEDDIILATDGGAYRQEIGGSEWSDIENNITTQFYRIAINPFDDNFYGGAQDNGTTGGAIDSVNNWPRIFGGDGFQMVFHPNDPNIWYVETQNGNIRITLDGGESYTSGISGLQGSRNWDMQYIMSAYNPQVMYTGTNKIYRSESPFAPSWFPISGDLTDTVDLSSARTHNISTLDESTINSNYLYCGTSDGLVWRSLDLGESWDLINEGLPRRYISDVKASRTNEETVYVTIQGYRDNDYTPYIYKSMDNGDTWESISGNLPQIAINDILLKSSADDENIFIGTDGGVYHTKDGGVSWERLGDDMPIIPVYDLALSNDNKLVAGTFARGIYTFDLGQLQDVSSEEISKQRIKLYPTITQSEFTIDGVAVGERIDILSWEGVFVRSETINSLNHIVDISDLPQGQYFIRPAYGSASRVVKI